jgi:chemotaxis protein MotB
MAEEDGQRPIIVKKVKKGGGHHGGAWKIAYADFVTAMMAFFLLMWLLGTISKGDLQGIADYFKTPLKVSLSGGSGSGDSTSVIQGGGRDVKRDDGQVAISHDPSPKRVNMPQQASMQAAQAEMERQDMARLQALKKKIEEAIEARPSLKQFKKQLLIDITSEGLRIQIVDDQNRPMFELGKAELQPYAKEILLEIGQMLNDLPNRITLSGHTDAKQYATGDKYYSNWELSADRANASRRALVAGGMDEAKLLKVVGVSSAVLFNKDDPFDPVNRRISIIVMNKRAEAAALKDNGTLEISNSDQAKEELGSGAVTAAAAAKK